MTALVTTLEGPERSGKTHLVKRLSRTGFSDNDRLNLLVAPAKRWAQDVVSNYDIDADACGQKTIPPVLDAYGLVIIESADMIPRAVLEVIEKANKVNHYINVVQVITTGTSPDSDHLRTVSDFELLRLLVPDIEDRLVEGDLLAELKRRPNWKPLGDRYGTGTGEV